MNTLTKNRILQKGDEYLDGEKWKAVPSNDYGLQIMFTKYAEVRRPSESAPEHSSLGNNDNPKQDAGATISPDSEKRMPSPEVATQAAIVTAKAEKEKCSAPTPSGAEPLPLSATYGKAAKTKVKAKLLAERDALGKIVDAMAATLKVAPVTPLPTIISAAAHKIPLESKDPAPGPVTFTSDELMLKFPPTPHVTFRGRNGTFYGKALLCHANDGEGIVSIMPLGQRGLKTKYSNAEIQIPAEIIPELTDWLIRHQK